jgi:hypothetical protein
LSFASNERLASIAVAQYISDGNLKPKKLRSVKYTHPMQYADSTPLLPVAGRGIKRRGRGMKSYELGKG